MNGASARGLAGGHPASQPPPVVPPHRDSAPGALRPLQHGQGEPAAIARMMKEQAEQERARQQRMEQLRVR